MPKQKPDPEPETRNGNCCGCHTFNHLYKVPGLFRYRCATCFKAEVGYYHSLTPTEEIRIRETQASN